LSVLAAIDPADSVQFSLCLTISTSREPGEYPKRK